MPIPTFIPGLDEPVLRRWLANITAHGPGQQKLTPLHRAMERAIESMCARETLRTFMVDEAHRISEDTQALLPAVWNYLGGIPRCAARFPGDQYIAERQQLPQDGADRLAVALQAYFREDSAGEATSIKRMPELERFLPGTYVMYYRDQLLKRLGKAVPPLARATRLEISSSPFGFRVVEVQEWEAKPPHQFRHRQRNDGVTFPYWKFLIALMNCQNYSSFKCLVFTKFISNFDLSSDDSPKFAELKGEMLTADQEGPYPSVRFICRRLEGAETPIYGTFLYEELDKAIVDHIS